jgi:hypothetical protein
MDYSSVQSDFLMSPADRGWGLTFLLMNSVYEAQKKMIEVLLSYRKDRSSSLR